MQPPPSVRPERRAGGSSSPWHGPTLHPDPLPGKRGGANDACQVRGPSAPGGHAKPGSRNLRAWTLLELLVVIALIALLASLLLPALARAKRLARNTACKGNLRQQALALNLFVDDVGAFPYRYQRGPNPALEAAGHAASWQESLVPYLGRRDSRLTGLTGEERSQIWRCPGERDTTMNLAVYGVGIVYGFYGYNASGLGARSPSDPLLGLGGSGTYFESVPTTETEVRSPSRMIAIGDGFFGDARGTITVGGIGLGRARHGAVSSNETSRAHGRHGGRANTGFCDGHVDSPTLRRLFVDQDDDALRTWNRDDEPHAERLR